MTVILIWKEIIMISNSKQLEIREFGGLARLSSIWEELLEEKQRILEFFIGQVAFKGVLIETQKA